MVDSGMLLCGRRMMMMMSVCLLWLSNNCVVVMSQEVSVNENDPSAKLLKACMAGRGEDDVKAIISALKEGANLNAKHEGSGQTCLMAAVLRGKINIVKHLLKVGADPTIPEKSGYTPPHGAAFQGRADVMKILIDAGLNVNEAHADGHTPLHRSCWGGEQRHTDTVTVLLTHGKVYHDVLSSPDAPTNPSMTCLDMTTNEATKDVIANFKGTDNL